MFSCDALLLKQKKPDDDMLPDRTGLDSEVSTGARMVFEVTNELGPSAVGSIGSSKDVRPSVFAAELNGREVVAFGKESSINR